MASQGTASQGTASRGSGGTRSEHLKHLLIRTPLEEPLKRVRRLLAWRRRRQHPELRDLFLEEERIEEALRRVARPDSSCIDVGCHLGSFLSTLLRVAPRGRHLAFEPTPYKAAWLRRKFPEVDLHEVALTDREGELSFFLDREHTGTNSLLKKPGPPADQVEIRVRGARLDDVLPADRDARFIKIDVEGAEIAVLRGARETLRRCRPLVVLECTRNGLESMGIEAREFHDFVTGDLGYSLHLIQEWLESGPPLSFDAFERAMIFPFRAFNFLAAPA